MDSLAQDADLETGVTEASTEVLDSAEPKDALAPDSTGQETPAQPGKEIPGTEDAQVPSFNPDEEQTIEFGGKTYTLKGKELQAILENQSALTEREKALNRDYTQKLQKLSQDKKSFETAFGRIPEPQELQALSKLWNSYFSDPQSQKVLDAILAGEDLNSIISGQPSQGKPSASPEVAALQSHIKRLEGQLSQFLSTSEQKEQQAAVNEGKRIFDSWLEGKTKTGAKVEETMHDAILEWAGFLRQKNPSWDASRALNEAYRHVTIDSVEKTATSKVFAKAESAKKAPTIKITPKSSQKAEANMGYRDIFQSAM